MSGSKSMPTTPSKGERQTMSDGTPGSAHDRGRDLDSTTSDATGEASPNPRSPNPAATSSGTSPTAGDSQALVFETGTTPVSPRRPLNPGLYAPDPANPAPEPATTVADVVYRLMHPDQSLYSEDGTTVTLTIIWAVLVAGPERFGLTTPPDGRHSLDEADYLHHYGRFYGLSPQIWEWLTGGEDTLTLPASHFA
ncbi:hypothetical protein BDV95DRAFT_590327 [Massariosphaeria phaeospora]|uniref:Uncharacterized protein n=1 Tax=Massariosphaeria phaeospora TaxID=100035 RepID=A0A7C8IGK3_9PLEO|nr:hypothetical protein BDV95DRAFT_590327 [Massariosphaeria phaeospora]